MADKRRTIRYELDGGDWPLSNIANATSNGENSEDFHELGGGDDARGTHMAAHGTEYSQDLRASKDDNPGIKVGGEQ